MQLCDPTEHFISDISLTIVNRPIYAELCIIQENFCIYDKVRVKLVEGIEIEEISKSRQTCSRLSAGYFNLIFLVFCHIFNNFLLHRYNLDDLKYFSQNLYE